MQTSPHSIRETYMFSKLAFFILIASKTAQGAPKIAPRRPKRPPRGPEDGPRGPQEGPKTAQDGPRRVPSWGHVGRIGVLLGCLGVILAAWVGF